MSRNRDIGRAVVLHGRCLVTWKLPGIEGIQRGNGTVILQVVVDQWGIGTSGLDDEAWTLVQGAPKLGERLSDQIV